MFQLMLKDAVCAEFELISGYTIKLASFKQIGKLPIGCTESNFLKWLEKRNAAKHRQHLAAYLQQIGCRDIIGFLKLTHGISLNDCFWVRSSDEENLLWESVSPYRNEYSEMIQRLAFMGAGLYGEQLTSTSPEFGTSGTFDKCWVRDGNDIFMIKRGSSLGSNSGLEPYGEVLASQVFSAMKAGIPYKLVKYHGQVASKCKLFNNEKRSFVAYGNLGMSTDIDVMLKYYDSFNSDIFRRILICDAITLNTDRHSGNHGVFYDSESLTVISPAVGYDYNLAMMPYMTNEDFAMLQYKFWGFLPKIGTDFISVARHVMTPEIRRDLINLKGVKLELPWYDERFTKERAEWLTVIVNQQIENILSNGEPKVPVINMSNLTNCMKYRIKFKLFDDDSWFREVPRLMKLFNISHMTELEDEISKLL